MGCYLTKQLINDVLSVFLRVQRQNFKSLIVIVSSTNFFFLLLVEIEVVDVLAVMEGGPSVGERLWSLLVDDAVEEG
jgi:hypothetical protein